MKHQSHRVRRSVAALAVTLAGGASALGLASAAQAATTTSATSYTFTTLDNQADPTFNQLLGINSHNVIAGYFGIGRRRTRTRATCWTRRTGRATTSTRTSPARRRPR